MITKNPQDTLTTRELSVIKLVAVGMANADIGRELGITEGNVKKKMVNICDKLGAANRVMVARWHWMTYGFGEPASYSSFAVDHVPHTNC